MLVVGADALSRYVDWRDRGTCILFGDGAGAVLVQGVAGAPCSLLGFDMNSDGNGNKHLTACYRGPAGAKPTASGSSAEMYSFERRKRILNGRPCIQVWRPGPRSVKAMDAGSGRPSTIGRLS